MKHSEIKPGQRVLYVPNHAHGDRTHADVERGIVTRLGSETVFVCYDGESISKATLADNLELDEASTPPLPKHQRAYLGDGAYVAFDGFALEITTEDGISVQNRVVLEPYGMAELVRFALACGYRLPVSP